MKIRFYLLSMWLFFIIVIILSFPCKWKDLATINCINFILPVLAFVGFVYVTFFFAKLVYKKKKDSLRLSVKIKEIEVRNYDTLAFLASYFIPLVSFNLGSIRHQLVLVILFVAIGVIYVQVGMYYANPTLALLGLKTYNSTITFQDGSEKCNLVIISLYEIKKGDNITYISIDENVYYAKLLN